MISTVLRGDVAAQTISILWMKLFLIVLCLRHWVSHHCGDPDPFRTTGQTSADLPNPRLLTFLESKHGAFSILRKALGLRPNDQSYITKRGFIWIFLIRTPNGPIKLTTTGTFASKGLRILHTVFRKRRISETLSDFSLSSQMCDHSHMMFTVLRNMFRN